MKLWSVFSLIIFACSFFAVAVEDPTLEAVVTRTEDNRFVVDVISDSEMKSPQFSHYNNQWVEFYEPKAQEDGRFLYRVKQYQQSLNENVILRVKHKKEESKDDLVVHKFVVPALTDGETELRYRGTQTEKERPAVEEASGSDPGLAIINRYRRQRGLRPIQYDSNFANISRENNRRGGRHNYNPGGWQTWASSSSPEQAVRMWMGPYWSSHGVIIMNPSITRGGTHSGAYGTTFTGR